MKFNEKLNEYLEELGCTAKQISKISGLSPATVSRYRSGTSFPEKGSKQLKDLSYAISFLAQNQGKIELTADIIEAEFYDLLNKNEFDYNKLRENLNSLIQIFSISIAELSSALNYDSSHLVRIRNGERRPGDPDGFVNGVARFVVNNYSDYNMKTLAAKLMNCNQEDIKTQNAYLEMLIKWLTCGQSEIKNTASEFLKKIDAFDLNEYIRAIHFDDLKVPGIPLRLPRAKKAMTANEMMNIELDFIKATVLSKSTEPVIMYSDMPFSEMAENIEFAKKWMFGIAMMVKKGLHLHQIHNIDRSFEEMMLGIEGWIPLYMTGQVSPYYLKSPQNTVFNHFLKVSGSAALWGEAIADHKNDGMLYLTNQKDELKYYKTHAQQLLKKALPLMDIYNENSRREFEILSEELSEIEGTRRTILCTPPVYTMTDEFAEAFLSKRNTPPEEKERILTYIHKQIKNTEEILNHSIIKNEITVLSQEEIQLHPPVLSLAGMFYKNDLKYTYEEYLMHLKLTEEFAKTHTNCKISENNENAFRNVQIYIHEGKYVIVSKEKSPTIHFVIKHPKLRSAIENMIVPISEKYKFENISETVHIIHNIKNILSEENQ